LAGHARLQRTATHRSTPKNTATQHEKHCNCKNTATIKAQLSRANKSVRTGARVILIPAKHCNTLQHCKTTLQNTAKHRNTLQHTATLRTGARAILIYPSHSLTLSFSCSLGLSLSLPVCHTPISITTRIQKVQATFAHRNTQQHNALQHTAVHCNTLQQTHTNILT